MRFFIDTEFIEGQQTKRVFGFPVGKTKPTIDLISLGLVCQDGRKLYLISNEFNLNEAWNRYELKEVNGKETKVYWLRENVLLPIYTDFIHGDLRNRLPFSKSAIRYIMDNYGNSQDTMKDIIKSFIKACCNGEEAKFFGYYSDYDWVVFCWIFGRMIELPEGFPMLCYDVKQMLDEKCKILKFKEIKKHADYPVQTNSHDSMEDALWIKKLYEFTVGLKVWRSKKDEPTKS